MIKPFKLPPAPAPSFIEQAMRLRGDPKGRDTERLKAAVLPLSRQWLDEQRLRLRQTFESSGDAGGLLAAYTQVIDQLIGALFECGVSGKSPMVAAVAVGGYGRSELFPYSDIDILFLYDAKHEAEAARIAEFILYILWDLGLKVGQAHRTVDEAVALAGSDMTIRTNLIDTRFICGKEEILASFRQRFDQEVVAGTAMEFVEAKLAERDERHRRFGDSRYMLEPNVKEGKGGLRDLHTLWWLARYTYPIHELKDLVGMKLLTSEEYRAFDQARQFLWRVRAHLHYLTGRAEERLTFDHQHALAVAMGFAHPSINYAIARFMRRYFVAVRMVGTTTRIFCALLEEDRKRKPRKALGWLWHAPWKLGNFLLDGERINVRNDHAFEQNPLLMLELFRTAQQHGLDIHPRALRLVSQNLHRIDDTVRTDPKANGLFMEMLLDENGPESTLRRMSDSGVLGRFIPDFGRIIGQTQFNMYHVYTVDEHTLVALGILHALESGRLKEELPLASDVVPRIRMRRVLYLALFCHDIAKGRAGDHSELGEKVAARLAARFQFLPDEVETAAWLVRYHLLFSNTAFKRDIDDPKAVQDFVAMVKTPERLKLLLVLTVADIRAVGPATWNAWKASLLRELYRRAEQCMGTGDVEIKQHQTRLFKDDIAKLLPSWPAQEVEQYLEQGNPTFLASFDPPRHAAIARMMQEAQRMQLPLVLDTQHDYERSITEVILCTYDQHGLFSRVTGAMSLAGANIINAKIFTLKNGMAVEVFQVQDTVGQVFDRADRLAKMSVYIEQALSGELDLAQAVARSGPAFVNPSRHAVPTPGQVFIDNDASNICSVVELSGYDRPGFLYQITRTMTEQGLTIATAHISTYGTQAADVFYVKDVFGMKLTHEQKLKQVREALLEVIDRK